MKKKTFLTTIFLMIAALNISFVSGAIAFDTLGDDIDLSDGSSRGTITGASKITITGSGDNDNFVITSSATTQEGAWIYSNTARSGGAVLLVQDDHASTSSNTLKVVNDGTGDSIFIDTNGDGSSIDIDSSATTKNVIQLNNAGTGDGIYINQVGHGRAIDIDQAGNEYGVFVQQDGLQSAYYADQNSNEVALEIDSEATTQHGISMDVWGARAIFRSGDAQNTIATHYFSRDVNSGVSNAPVLKIAQENTGDNQNTLLLNQSGTGAHLGFEGSVAACPAAGNHLISNTTGIYACVGGGATKIN